MSFSLAEEEIDACSIFIVLLYSCSCADVCILCFFLAECLALFTDLARGYKTKLILNSIQLEIILLINVKMSTIVGILTFKGMINTTSEMTKERNFLICGYLSFYDQIEFRTKRSALSQQVTTRHQ